MWRHWLNGMSLSRSQDLAHLSHVSNDTRIGIQLSDLPKAGVGVDRRDGRSGRLKPDFGEWWPVVGCLLQEVSRAASHSLPPSSAFPQSTNLYWMPAMCQTLCLGTQTQWWMRAWMEGEKEPATLQCAARVWLYWGAQLWTPPVSTPLPCNFAISSHSASGLAWGLALANRISKAEVIHQSELRSAEVLLLLVFQTSVHCPHTPRLDCWRTRDLVEESSVTPAETVLN